MKHKFEKGSRIGRLVVVEELDTYFKNNGSKSRRFLTKCDCGNDKIVDYSALSRGETQSCGCLLKGAKTYEMYVGPRIRHGLSKSTERNSYKNMKLRCYATYHRAYQWYGAKGIKVCDRWMIPGGQGLVNFYNDMGPKPAPNYQLDRIDLTKDYCPENCRWVSHRDNQQRRTNSVTVNRGDMYGDITIVMELPRENGIRMVEGKCSCGKVKKFNLYNLRAGKNKTCKGSKNKKK
jgi:hypothetical protein